MVEKQGETGRVAWGSRAAAVLLMVAMATGCGLNDRPQSNMELDEELDVRIQELNAFCSVEVEGYGSVDVETDYLPSVVACENGNAPMEALKAQAVAARTYAAFQAEAGAEPLAPTTDDQVYNCDYTDVDQRHIDAVEATEGQVLTRNGSLIAAFYVAGAIPSSSTCQATGSDPDETNTEQYVTYNQGRSGGQVQPTSLGHPDNPANRGAKSQNGATCLADEGWDYERILRYYYGDDVRARVAEESQCVSSSVDGGQAPPSHSDDVCNFGGGTQDSSTCADPSQKPDIRPRSAWNARPPNSNRPHHTPDRMTVHHTVTPNNEADGAGRVRNIQQQHMNQGWADIGYHYVISWDGTIYEANPVNRIGAHAGGDNTGNIGVAVLGRFDQSGEPSSEQIESLTKMLRYLGDEFDIPLERSNIQGHGEWPSQATACPGTNLQNQLDTVVANAGSDAICRGGDEQAGGSGGDISGFRYVRVHGVDESPLTEDNPVDGFEVDAIYGSRNGSTIEASSVHCSPGVSNANAALGLPDNDSCDNRLERVAGVPVGADLVVELSEPLGEGDVLNVAQHAYQAAMASCEPTGTAKISVSEDGKIWKVLDENASENWTRTLSSEDFAFDENDQTFDGDEGFEFIKPTAGESHTNDLTFRSIASYPGVVEVEYYVPESAEDVIDEDWIIGSSSSASSQYEVSYEFQYLGERIVGARALDADGNVVAYEEITITVTNQDGVIPGGESQNTPSPLGEMDQAMADALAAEGGRCYSQFDDETSGDRCSNGTGGWTSGLCWHFVKRALERAGVPWTQLEHSGPCTHNRFHLSAYGFQCNADANPSRLANMGLKKVDVATTEAPAGAVIAWDRGCQGFNSQHGHIEISMGNGTACSDYCGNIRPDASCASVYVPVQ